MKPSFPCVEAHAVRAARIAAAAARPARRIPNGASFGPSSKQNPALSSPEFGSHYSPSSNGPEPPYARPSPSSYHIFHSSTPLPLTYAPALPSFDLAYETWGTLSRARDNAILLFTGLSASSHAAATPSNPAPGWWQKFIGPGKALDTDRFFVICVNVLGGCYGSTGPSSIDPATGGHYATRFPVVSIFDMVNAQFRLLDHLGIGRLYASVGSSMGAMQSLAAGVLHADRAGKIVSISGTARSSPSSVAMRFAQRSGTFSISQVFFSPHVPLIAVLMADPNWKNGFYYDGLPPHTGMKLARRTNFMCSLYPRLTWIDAFIEIATITYRSGPEWDLRFGRGLRTIPNDVQLNPLDPSKPRLPQLCPDFLIETYLDHQVRHNVF